MKDSSNQIEKEIIKEIVFSNFSSLFFLLLSNITVSKLILLYLIEHVIIGFFDSLKIILTKPNKNFDSTVKISVIGRFMLIFSPIEHIGSLNLSNVFKRSKGLLCPCTHLRPIP